MRNERNENRHFLADAWLVRDPRGAIDEDVLWFLYTSWCDLDGRPPLCRRLFLRVLPTSGLANGDGLVYGIRLSELGEILRALWESANGATLEEIAAGEVVRKDVEDIDSSFS